MKSRTMAVQHHSELGLGCLRSLAFSVYRNGGDENVTDSSAVFKAQVPLVEDIPCRLTATRHAWL